MSAKRRLDRARRLLDTPPPAAVPGQLPLIPDAAVAAMAAGLEDYRLTTPDHQQTPHGAAERAAEYLASSGWTVTPAT
ncbi:MULTISPECIES: hypothetical protein [unclassified Streptomyces]|uniref:hypothetical protein n=1 Tax=Streptomyces sp. NPDC127129 TaxID=3345373 RepID=UPI00363B8F75